MLTKFKNYINQPYPDKDDMPSNIKGAVLGGIIVFFILYFLQPFGLHMLEESLIYYALGFGLISVIVALVYDLVVKYILKIRRDSTSWTLWKWCVAVIILILLIAIANYIFIIQMDVVEHSTDSFWQMLYSTIVISVFPIFLSGSINLNSKLRANINIASAISQEPRKATKSTSVELPINKSDKKIKVDVASIIFAEAKQNYVTLYCKRESGVESIVVRNTIKNIENELSQFGIIQSHRSFLVNPSTIESVSGNAQGLKLKLVFIEDFEVPVSRKYIAVFKNL